MSITYKEALRTVHDNPHSDKWNTHTSRGDLPQSIFDYWSRQLQSVLA
jgi:hypothetical protein